MTVICGPAVCQGCRELVWWGRRSDVPPREVARSPRPKWRNADGLLHRCVARKAA